MTKEVKLERKKRIWNKDRLSKRNWSSAEETSDEKITDQRGALSKAQLMLALSRGAILKSNGKPGNAVYEKGNCLVDMEEIAMTNAYRNFDLVQTPKIEKAIENAKAKKEDEKLAYSKEIEQKAKELIEANKE